MKFKSFAFILSVLFGLFLLEGCDDKDKVEEMQHFTFSQDYLTVDSSAQLLSVLVTNAKELREWNIQTVSITDDNHQNVELENEPIPSVSGSSDYIIPDTFQKEWFDIRKSDDGETLSISITRNEGGERLLDVTISNGYDYGVFHLIQKTGK